MTLEFLREIGFTEGEIKVYNSLLELGSTTTGKLVKDAGISSSKIYEILDKLMRKGVAAYVLRSGIRYYSATNPENLVKFIHRKRDELKKQEEFVSEMLPRLLMRKKASQSVLSAEIYEGLRGVKNYFNDTLNRLKRGDEMLVFGARSGYPVSKSAQRFFRSFHKRRAKNGVFLKIIFNKDLKDSKLSRFFSELNNTKVRFIDQATLSSIGIQRGSIDILVWTKNTSIVFIIRSKEVSNTFKKYFNILWEAGEKV